MYKIKLNDYRDLYTARYFNSNGHAVAIVAVTSKGPSGIIIDWVAYIGGSDFVEREQDALLDVAQNGDKISRADAEYFFPDFKEFPYRN